MTANTTKVDEAEAEAAEVATGAASDTRANKVAGAEAMAAENAEGQPRQRKSTKQRQRLRRFRRGSKDNEGRRSRGRGCGGFGRAAKTTKVDGAEAEAASDDKILRASFTNERGRGAAGDGNRYILNGVFFEFAEGKITVGCRTRSPRRCRGCRRRWWRRSSTSPSRACILTAPAGGVAVRLLFL